MSDQQIQLMQGDCLELMRLIPDGSVDLIVTDPPYPVISGGNVQNYGKVNGFKASVLSKNDGKIFEHNDITPEEYLPDFYRILKADADLYLMTNNLNMREFLNAAHDAGFKLHNILVWDKAQCNPNRWYVKHLEWTLYLYKGVARTINMTSSKQLFSCPNPRNKAHPCEKPVHLMNQYILNSSQVEELVCDPFMGSGPAAESAMMNRRRFIGMEKDPHYFEVAQKRLKDMTHSLFAGTEK